MVNHVEEIKERLNIVDLISEYLPLKKAGVNYKGLCPFHNEKTPSFTVSEQKQFFHCFGCAKGGDIFTFLQEIEGVEFAEALRMLASKAGVELTTVNPREHNERTRLLDCLSVAMEFFKNNLKNAPAGKIARTYLTQRQLSLDIQELFNLGYALESWDALLKFLKEQKFTQKEIERSGLIVRSEKNNSFYDRFRNRLMFPITNVYGNVIGFTARVLDENDKSAKYINTPQTEVYNKSRALYGLSLAKKYIQKMDAVVLVEGNIDVLTAHQAKLRNVVASSGTALTEEQVRLLKRYTQNIILAFDADTAGVKAAWRGMQIAIRAGMNIKILKLPNQQDPDDVIKKNPQQFLTLAKAAKPIMDYAFTVILKPLDLSQAFAKKKAAQELLPMIALFPDKLEQQHYLKQLAVFLEVDVAVLKDKITTLAQSSLKHPVKTGVIIKEKTEPSIQEKTEKIKLLERLLALLLAYPEGIEMAQVLYDGQELSGQEEELKILYKKIISLYNQDKSFPLEKMTFEGARLPQKIQQLQLIGEELYSHFDQAKLKKELVVLLRRIRRFCLQDQLKEVEKKFTLAEKNQDEQTITNLSQELRNLTEILRTLS
ncbi:MAG: DNA primase [Candidatus Kerfeldbacteria bacterium RIFOXYB2_FULL_38_14]|uniref:DNA primase n=1 Tax=Candidatus Kerfeldbacteria bacterium RIFOXYB2_FULL_38_14 TaxID=1798547 RepID=A0A1G2BF04_9BACT|nr:MAG: DNA primase [Candidatus Kerfeldbacteria bacterium RIFOXYB2_FULL_38_14]